MTAAKPACTNATEVYHLLSGSDEPAPTAEKAQYPALGYLRAFLTVLMVAHHAILTYHPFRPPLADSLSKEYRMWRAFPVIDSKKSQWFAVLIGFNDIFFMSLMFFVSGIFV